MLAVWKTWGLPSLLKEALMNGTILTGISADAICWFESGLIDSDEGVLGPIDCLGFLNGGCCPHYSLEPDRKPSYDALIAGRKMLPGFAIDDGAAIYFIDGSPERIVSATAKAMAYAVSSSSNNAKTELIKNAEIVDVTL
jgi:peptidase E